MNASSLLLPLPYHREVCDYLRAEEAELWAWFASARAHENYAEELQLSLLKTTYRLAPDTHPDLYAQCSAAKAALALDIPVTIYQAQAPSSHANAHIYFLPREAHIILSGPITTLLSGLEMMSVFGHELAHYYLWQAEDGRYLIADRILDAVTRDRRAQPAHHETARQYRLHTEIFADRGAAAVTQNLAAVIAALVKIATGLATVSGESYLAQAEEILSKTKAKTDELSHPESYIRAHALALWTRQGELSNDGIRQLIAGESSLDQLDLTSQNELSTLTLRLLAQLLRSKWFQTDPVLSLAKLYFPHFQPTDASDPSLIEDLLKKGSLTKTYFAYILLDFVNADRELEEVPLAATLLWAEQLGIGNHFEKLLSKELGVKARAVAKLKPRISDLLALAERGAVT